MPFFSSKFSPKKTPLRRNQLNGNNKESLDELVSETGVIKLNLHEQKLTFENGHWFAGKQFENLLILLLIVRLLSENGKNSSLHKSNVKLKQQIQALQEENNMLKLKNEILLNMVISPDYSFYPHF